MNARKSFTEQVGPSSVEELAGKDRDEKGRFPQIWTIQRAIEESKKHKNRKSFIDTANSAYQYLVKKKQTHRLFFEEKGKRHRLSDWEVFCAAKKSKTISEFRNNYCSQYSAFSKRKHINRSLLNHMPESKTAKKWSDEKIALAAENFKSKKEFRINNPKAYDAAGRNGVLNRLEFNEKTKMGDYDAVYIWTGSKDDNGTRLVKVGVTSIRLGMQRINQVKKSSGMNVDDLIIVKNKNATRVEVLLKAIGDNPYLTAFNGSTEFRLVNESQYLEMLGVINGNSKI